MDKIDKTDKIKNYELEGKVSCRKFRHTTQHGAMTGKTQTANTNLYNLDVIISVVYKAETKPCKGEFDVSQSLQYISVGHRPTEQNAPQVQALQGRNKDVALSGLNGNGANLSRRAMPYAIDNRAFSHYLKSIKSQFNNKNS